MLNKYGLQTAAYNEGAQETNALRSAYQGQRGDYTQGEQGLAGLFNQASPELQEMYNKTPQELEQLKESILKGNAKQLQQGTSQFNAALAQQGVRGGQAATQQRRQIGETTDAASQSIQDLISTEALNRRNRQTQEAENRGSQQRQYEMGKQGNIQQFLQQQAAYSDPTQKAQMINPDIQMQAMKDAFEKYNISNPLLQGDNKVSSQKSTEEYVKLAEGGKAPVLNLIEQEGLQQGLSAEEIEKKKKEVQAQITQEIRNKMLNPDGSLKVKINLGR